MFSANLSHRLKISIGATKIRLPLLFRENVKAKKNLVVFFKTRHRKKAAHAHVIHCICIDYLSKKDYVFRRCALHLKTAYALLVFFSNLDFFLNIDLF